MSSEQQYTEDDIGMDVIVTSDELFNGRGFLATVVDVTGKALVVDIEGRDLGAPEAQVSVDEVTPFDELVALL